MDDVKKSEQRTEDEEPAPRGGMPRDGAGRIEDPGSRHSGVWPMSGPPPDDPELRAQGMASFGQGERGAAGYFDSGQSEVVTVPPGDVPAGVESATTGRRGNRARLEDVGVGEVGSNAGEVDPGVSGSGETTDATPG
jgi:hypothetical protein